MTAPLKIRPVLDPVEECHGCKGLGSVECEDCNGDGTRDCECSECHDVHERLKPVDAIRFARELEPFDLFFLEDAIPLEDGEWLRQLREKTTTPIAQGELFNHPFEWRSLVANRTIDFIRVHLSQVGGITPSRKLALFAEQYGVRTAWHGPGDMSPLAHAANIHIDLASRNFGVQEWSGTEPPNFVIQELKGPREALLDVFPDAVAGDEFEHAGGPEQRERGRVHQAASHRHTQSPHPRLREHQCPSLSRTPQVH